MFSRLPSITPSLPRRAASSFSAPCSSITHPPKSSASLNNGRGRAKPSKGVSVGTRLSAAKLTRSSDKRDSSASVTTLSGRGRTKPRHFLPPLSSSDALNNRFSGIGLPIQTNPLHSALHLACTPSHQPLPIPLGPEQYFRPRGTQVNPVPAPEEWTDATLGPFDASLSKRSNVASDISDVWIPETGRSGLTDHLHVLWSLDRPDRSHFLLKQPSSLFDADYGSAHLSLNRAVGEASARNRVKADREWNNVLARLGDAQQRHKKEAARAKEVQVRAEEKNDVASAVEGLNALMGKLALEKKSDRRKSIRVVAVVGPDGDEQFIRMDSIRQKRKKKMNKHKFKKRRKAQAALRRKLGK